MRNRIGNILFGIAFIAAGVLFAGNALNLWHFTLFFNGWWTLFIIVPCVISLIKSGFRPIPLIGLFIGALLLLTAQGVIDGRTASRLTIPAILVIIGICILCQSLFGRGARKAPKVKDGMPDYTAIFGSVEELYPAAPFYGASMSGIFGGAKLDLTHAVIESDVTIQSLAVFGSTELIVPPNVNVKVSSIPIFGGTSNKSHAPLMAGAPTIYVNSTCIFGGMDIK